MRFAFQWVASREWQSCQQELAFLQVCMGAAVGDPPVTRSVFSVRAALGVSKQGSRELCKVVCSRKFRGSLLIPPILAPHPAPAASRCAPDSATSLG